MELFRVRLSQDDIVFSAGHFITFNGDVCERLHGHDYRVSVDVEGPLDENHYVIDFVALRKTLKAIVEELDHRVLLPTGHPLIQVDAGEREVEVRFRDRRWILPRCDCRLLPVPNTTTELLARHIGQRLLDELQKQTGTRPKRVRIEVEESLGQAAIWEFWEA